jgi:hypothetical protein
MSNNDCLHGPMIAGCRLKIELDFQGAPMR